MNEIKYYMRYLFKPESREDGWTKQEIDEWIDEQANDNGIYCGAADAMILHSILKPKNEGYSTADISFDGTTDNNKLSALDEFKVWLLMAARLNDNEDLSLNHRKFLNLVLESIREAIL